MKSFILIIRPLNLLITAFASFIAYFIVAKEIEPINLVLIILSTVLTAGAGNIINDIIDIDIDLINKPQRPLPSKNMTVGSAYIWYGFLVDRIPRVRLFSRLPFLRSCHTCKFHSSFLYHLSKKKTFLGEFRGRFHKRIFFYFCSITTGKF
jgi:hypothetical protein